MNDLLPCPFCGNDYLLLYCLVGNKTVHRVECTECSLIMTDLKQYKLIDKWNKRYISNHTYTLHTLEKLND